MKLTEVERLAVRSQLNLADGHAHQGVLTRYSSILSNLPSIFDSSDIAAQGPIEADFIQNFYALARQPNYVTGRILIHYSSSIVIEAVAHVLLKRRSKVALLHPTFDNLADILRRVGVDVSPITEKEILDPEKTGHFDVMFLVLPNNPTGFHISKQEFENLASRLSQNNQSIIVDASFRFFGDWAFDAFSVLNAYGVEHVFIEDTGKTWDIHDLKCGFANVSSGYEADMISVFDDMLLNVSPFILSVINEFIKSDLEHDPAMTEIRETCRQNREKLKSALAGFKFSDVSLSSEMSVALVGSETAGACEQLLEACVAKGLVFLPGAPFWWASDEGANYVRISLMRESVYFDECMKVLRSVLTDLAEGSSLESSKGRIC